MVIASYAGEVNENESCGGMWSERAATSVPRTGVSSVPTDSPRETATQHIYWAAHPVESLLFVRRVVPAPAAPAPSPRTVNALFSPAASLLPPATTTGYHTSQIGADTAAGLAPSAVLLQSLLSASKNHNAHVEQDRHVSEITQLDQVWRWLSSTVVEELFNTRTALWYRQYRPVSSLRIRQQRSGTKPCDRPRMIQELNAATPYKPLDCLYAELDGEVGQQQSDLYLGTRVDATARCIEKFVRIVCIHESCWARLPWEGRGEEWEVVGGGGEVWGGGGGRG